MEENEIKALVERILKEAAAKTDRRYTVLIAGGSASGKTYLAKRLKEALGNRAVLISADDYYRGIEFMRAEMADGNRLCWDQPEAVDLEMLARDLKELAAGNWIKKPYYDFSTGRRTHWYREDPKEITLCEGLHVLDEPVVALGDLKTFCSAGTHGRAIRRMIRDVAERGQKLEDVIRYFAEWVEPMHRMYVEPTKKNADLVIDSEYRPDIESGRAGEHEEQVKFRFDYGYDFGIASEWLVRRHHAKPVYPGNASHEQVDRYYNPSDRDLVATGEILRVRQENAIGWLTYKGPISPDGKRSRFQCEIDEATEAALRQLYDGNVKQIVKLRRLYRYYGKLVFSLDLLLWPGLPQFLEFRLETDEDEQAMKHLVKELGLNPDDRITSSYVEML